MSLRLLYLVSSGSAAVVYSGWLVLPGRSSASTNAELLLPRHEVAVPRWHRRLATQY